MTIIKHVDKTILRPDRLDKCLTQDLREEMWFPVWLNLTCISRPRQTVLPELKGKLKNAMKTTKTAAKKNKISVPTADELWSIAIPRLKWKARPSQTASNMFQANASNQLTSTDISNCNNWISLTDAERLVELQQLRHTMSQKQ